MKSRYTLRSSTDVNSEIYLQNKGFCKGIARALSARGVNENNFEQYFGEKSVWHSPFEMPNMQQACETISYVMETGGNILIYGDYDADGLTASSLLSLYFTDNGISNSVIIPTRDEGYGLHVQTIVKAFERNYYDLIITVDCGISNKEEIDVLQDELGVEIIVTDHHELPQQLPNCLCVNPKMGYPFFDLSGAGVAWKLVEALSDRETASKYSYLAMIGTIGDIMPLKDENRSIVNLGIACFQHKSLKKLAELSSCGGTLSSNDVAMRITPKINAAGRVGNTTVALEVLLARDKLDEAKVQQLLQLNQLRKQMMEDIIADADAMCDAKTFFEEKMVFVYSDHWAHGVLGIVASRYKEKYGLPALVMTLDGDNYVGSARGIDSLNLFDAFCACKQWLTKFGGHKLSVGFSVAKNDIDSFRNAMSRYLNGLDDSCFEQSISYDFDLPQDCSAQDVIKLSQALQPLLPQDKLLCRVTDTVTFANAFGKDGSPHLSATLASGLELKGFFKYGKYAPYVKNAGEIDCICSIDVDNYTGKVCGTVEDLIIRNGTNLDEFYKQNLCQNFQLQDDLAFCDEQTVCQLIAQPNTICVFDDYETYLKYAQQFDFEQYFVDVFFDNSISNKTIVVSPLPTYNYSKYRNVVYFVGNEAHLVMPSNTVYFNCKAERQELYRLSMDRNVCAQVFVALKNKSKYDSVRSVYDKWLFNKLSYCQFVVALRIFEQLQLLSVVDEFTINLDTSRKVDLSSSSIFCHFANKQEGDR